MKFLHRPLKPILFLGFAVSMFPTLALAQLFYPQIRYRIRSALADKVLEVTNTGVDNGVKIQLDARSSGPNQIWSIEIQPDGTYVIRSGSSSLVLDVDLGTDPKGDGNRVQQRRFHGEPNQRWRIQPVNPRTPGSAYMIISVGSNKALDAVLDPGTNTVHDGTELQQWKSTGGVEPAMAY
jgi:hypothetical protein